jgi:RNA polymerase sigma-70 factor, ECF subfamily
VDETVPDDQRLVSRMRAGDETAFEDFFDRYFPGLFRFAVVRLHHDADAAEEVVQATLCRAVQKLHTFRGEAALFTWLCTFCRHEISAHYRKNRRVDRQVELVEDVPEVRAALESLSRASADRPEEALRRLEVARLVQATLDFLPPRYGDALEWKYVHGLSVKEIAERLKLGPKAAESLLTRAREAFRDGFAAVSAASPPREPGRAGR